MRKHIIWDWNGTLIDDAWLCLEIINGLLIKRNFPTITLQQYQEAFGFPVKEYYQKVGFDFSTEPFTSINTEFVHEYERRRPECNLRAGTLKAISGFNQRGTTQSILSASKQEYLEQAVDHFNIRHYFISINGLDDHHAFGKEKIAKIWISESHLNLRDMILVGDTIHDYEVAAAIGIDCFLIFSGHQDRKRLESCGAKIIESSSELFSMF